TRRILEGAPGKHAGVMTLITGAAPILQNGLRAADERHGVAVGKIQFAIERAIFGERARTGNTGQAVAVELPVAVLVNGELRRNAARLPVLIVLCAVKIVAHDGRLPVRADHNAKNSGVPVKKGEVTDM